MEEEIDTEFRDYLNSIIEKDLALNDSDKKLFKELFSPLYGIREEDIENHGMYAVLTDSGTEVANKFKLKAETNDWSDERAEELGLSMVRIMRALVSRRMNDINVESKKKIEAATGIKKILNDFLYSQNNNEVNNFFQADIDFLDKQIEWNKQKLESNPVSDESTKPLKLLIWKGGNDGLEKTAQYLEAKKIIENKDEFIALFNTSDSYINVIDGKLLDFYEIVKVLKNESHAIGTNRNGGYIDLIFSRVRDFYKKSQKSHASKYFNNINRKHSLQTATIKDYKTFIATALKRKV